MVSILIVCGKKLLILTDEHRPYPQAILQVFGDLKFRRRKHHHGPRKQPVLRAPPGLFVGVVQKLRDARGNLLKVTTRALFGRRKAIRRHLRRLRIGRTINTSHLERLNGTMRDQQARLARRTRSGSRKTTFLTWSLNLWRDLYNWTHVHAALAGRTPAMAVGLTQTVWSVLEYIRYPVHVGDLQREAWEDQRSTARESPLDAYVRKKALPMS